MNTPVVLRNITNDTGKSSNAQRSACMTKFNAYLRHDQVHLTLPSDINWSTLRIVDLQDANANFLPDVFGRFGHYLFEHGNIKWKSADQYLSALKKKILTNYPTTLPIFVVFYSTLRLKLKRLHDQRADEDEVDLIQHHEPLTKKVLRRLCEYSYGNGDYTLRCICSMDFHCIGRIVEIIKLPIKKLEVKCRADSFFNSVFLRLRRFKTGSKNNLHLLHEAHKHSWSTDPLHSIADMLARGAVSKFLFTHYHDKANYVEMINSKIRAVLSTFTDADVEDCDTTREALSEMLTHGMRAAAVIHANCNRDIKKDWTDQRAGLASRDRPTTSEVSYDRLTDPTDLLVARANLDWRDVENGGSCPIFSQTIPIEDRFDFTSLADLIYTHRN